MLPQTMDRLRQLQPDTAADLERAHAEAWASTCPVSLERCRIRMAEMIGDEAGAAYRTPAALEAGFDENAEPDASEQAFLDFTEQFVTSVSSVSDADVDALLVHVSGEEAYTFISALYVLELSARMDRTLSATLSTGVAA